MILPKRRLCKYLCYLAVLGVYLYLLLPPEKNGSTRSWTESRPEEEFYSVLLPRNRAANHTFASSGIRRGEIMQFTTNARQKARRRRIEEYCSGHPPRNNRFLFNRGALVSMAASYLHCPITKAASTFFHRLLLTTLYGSANVTQDVTRNTGGKVAPRHDVREDGRDTQGNLRHLNSSGHLVVNLTRHEGRNKARRDVFRRQQILSPQHAQFGYINHRGQLVIHRKPLSSFAPSENATAVLDPKVKNSSSYQVINFNSPFGWKLLSDSPLPRPLFAKLGTLEDKMEFLSRAVKSVFVRDPYARMFSAFVDKAFAPNPFYWREWGHSRSSPRHGPHGQPAFWRLDTDRGRPRCQHNLKFSDVMTLMASRLHKLDIHFLSADSLCNPCDFRYDIVGKMETFPEDLLLLSETLILPITPYFASNEFKQDYTRDAIEDSVFSPFRWLKDVLPCMNKTEMGLRIWRKLQIRGLIDHRILFPFTSSGFAAATAQSLVEAAVRASEASTDSVELRLQKKQAFLEAYRSVNVHVLHRLRDYFMPDFLLFDYNPNNPDVYDRTSNLTMTGAFDWSKPWGE